MEDRKLSLAIQIVAASLLLGLAGSILLKGTSLGIGFTLFVMLAVSSGVLLYRSRLRPVPPATVYLNLAILTFAGMFCLRDAPSLKFLNLVVIGLLVGLMTYRRFNGSLAVGSLIDYPLMLVGQWFEYIGDAFNAFNLEGQWKQVSSVQGGQQLTGLLRGLIIATPLVLLFGGLFVAGDASFEKLVNNVFSLKAEDFWAYALIFTVCAVLTAGIFRSLMVASSVQRPPIQGPPPPPKLATTGVGLIEVLTTLGALILLFAIFVGTQLPYFFGTAQLAQIEHGYSIADYARRGFFELFWVAMLMLPVLLGADAVLRKNDVPSSIPFKVMAAILVGLVVVIMASAAHRMNLYISEGGLTVLRTYVMSIIVWLCATFVWFMATVLRDRPDRFAFGAMTLFIVGVFSLNILNPEALIARVNLTRVKGTLDTAYLNSLSMDSIPTVVDHLHRAETVGRRQLQEDMRSERQRLAESDCRSWTWSRELAQEALTRP